jgi:TolB-like protein/class 3 adenylate cyclase
LCHSAEYRLADHAGLIWEEALVGERVERRLAAILAAEVAGYSRLMSDDEEGTHQRLKDHLSQLVNPNIEEHHGRIVKNTGDGILAEFYSVVDAVRCAAETQREMAARNATTPEDERIGFRIGINLGDVIAKAEDIYGDGVNIAARLEGLAKPGGICVSDAVFRQVQGKVQAEFIDMGEQPLKNIARPVRVYRVEPKNPDPGALPSAGREGARSARATAESLLPLPDKPSIAVLPFQNLSVDPEQQYFADGMVEEIVTALSRIRWLFVIARNSSFAYKGEAIDIKQVGRELGVRYVLEGSVRKAGDRVRITAQLIEAETRSHLWADRFDGTLQDVFDLQDQVAVSVAGIIEPTLKSAEMRRSSERPTNDLTAYDLYLRALQNAQWPSRAGYTSALGFLDDAIGRDPNYAPALALAGFCHHALHVSGWTEALDRTREQGIELAARALRSSGGDAEALGRAAYTIGYFGEDIAAAIALLDRALELNPSFALGWAWGGWLRLWAGLAEAALPHFETALRLNPRDPHPSSLFGIGVSYFFARRLEEAKATLLRSLQQLPGWVPPYRFLAACCAHLGHRDEAREMIERLRRLTPLVLPRAENWRRPDYRELYLSGLRLAISETDKGKSQPMQ